MNRHLTGTIIIFIIVAIGSWGARSFGWYNDYWYTDVLLHTLSGIGFGLLWMGLTINTPIRNWFIFCIGVGSFAVLGSVAWEFWELAGWRLTPSQTQFYTPRLEDSLIDILCGFVGGLLSALTILNISKKENA